MKCPKCGYLGFETSERCRNCGYDFSLAVDSRPLAEELPLRSSAGAGAPLADFDLIASDTPPTEDAGRLDLDRVIGADPGALGAQGPAGAPGAAGVQGAQRAPGSVRKLPLFGVDDETPLITAPRPVRPPLSVRRTTPEIPRVRPRSTQPSLRPEGGDLALHIDPEATPEESSSNTAQAHQLEFTPAPPAARLGAAVIDVALLGTINVAVIYLTLALAGLTWQGVEVLPLGPLGGFLAILDGGYLIVFIAAAGQTIGKMVTGVRVMGDDGQRVTIAGAVLRAGGCAASLLTLGLGYLPAFLAADHRALQDRLAGTRVVRAR